MQEHLVLQSQKEQRRLHSWPTPWGSRWRSQGQRYSPSPQKTLIMVGRQLQQKWITSSSFDSQKSKSKKSSAPPLPPTQPPKTLSNSPPLLWPLLRGEVTLTSFRPRALKLTCVGHHWEASEHVGNDVYNHASMFSHVLLVCCKNTRWRDGLHCSNKPSLDIR